MTEQTNNTNTPNSTSELQVRRDKLAALRAAGKDPFEITRFDVDADSAGVIAEFPKFEQSGERYSVKMAAPPTRTEAQIPCLVTRRNSRVP